ncbi:hypothetical protein [Bacillus sp. FJAT-49736]|uniref:hypothetical protein n=1 Tax=Bacillus sp. FJAT-49736 TaxID=2833582 RepID=UPI001BC8DECE|nr:hypothetical protein [Bacillus sp. FJAT-49736]MBS4173042.1 hypothetical protein [Bacillus sp. FJAT-49736]
MKQNVFIILLLFLFTGFWSTSTYATTNNNENLVDFQIEMLDWKKVNKIIPRYSKFTVIDVETRKSFRVQRRAGRFHADVQPLTKKDTKIMKEIYNGQWSWRRRAILIQSQNKLIAASMHGMPHGAGALDNGFRGHFCIHFKGSVTHRSERSDLSHQVMIHKAGGTIDEFVRDLTADQLTTTFLVFIKNGDLGLAKKVALTNHKKIKKELQKIKAIDAINWKLLNSEELDPYALEASIPVEVSMMVKKVGPVKTTVTFQLIRTSPISPWKINVDPLLSLTKK